MIEAMAGLQWFALAVVPRKEKATARALRTMGYEEFLPLYRERRRWSDRMQTVEMPLFPGYVFCRLDARDRLPVLKMSTVHSFVGLGKSPVPVPESEIEALRLACSSGLNPLPCAYLTIGAKVTIKEGPLAGVEGILTENRTTRLVLSVTLLQRSVEVEIDRNWIAPLQTYAGFGSPDTDSPII